MLVVMVMSGCGCFFENDADANAIGPLKRNKYRVKERFCDEAGEKPRGCGKGCAFCGGWWAHPSRSRVKTPGPCMERFRGPCASPKICCITVVVHFFTHTSDLKFHFIRFLLSTLSLFFRSFSEGITSWTAKKRRIADFLN